MAPTQRRKKKGKAPNESIQEPKANNKDPLLANNDEAADEETDAMLEKEIRRMDEEVARRAKAREDEAARARGDKVSSSGLGPDGKPLPFTQNQRLQTAVCIGILFSVLYHYTEWFDQVAWPLAYIAIWLPLMVLVMRNVDPDEVVKDLKGPLGRDEGEGDAASGGSSKPATKRGIH